MLAQKARGISYEKFLKLKHLIGFIGMLEMLSKVDGLKQKEYIMKDPEWA